MEQWSRIEPRVQRGRENRANPGGVLFTRCAPSPGNDGERTDLQAPET